MFGTKRMMELQLRKSALLLESDLNRLALRGQCERLGDLGGWASRLAAIRDVVGRWALPLAPFAGLAMAVGLRRRSGWLGTLGKAVSLAGPLMQFWRARKTPPNETQP